MVLHAVVQMVVGEEKDGGGGQRKKEKEGKGVNRERVRRKMGGG